MLNDTETHYSLEPVECAGCGCPLVVCDMRDRMFCSNRACKLHAVEYERPVVKLKKAKAKK